MKPKAVKDNSEIFFGSFSHKCQPMTVKEPSKYAIQTSSPKTADDANDIEEKPQAEPRCHWRCRCIGAAEKSPLSIGKILLGVSTRSKYAGKSSEVGTLPPGAT